MYERIRFLINRIGERLWVKPLLMCITSVIAVFVAKTADDTGLGERVPEITVQLLEVLLTIMSSSMLVIATFAVGSMVSSYASASSTATPRSFALVVADDVSQNALSTFIGAFIFSIVALIVLKSGYFDTAARFTLFLFTLGVFSAVILTFVRWVDRIARLGRIGATIDKVEAAAAEALQRRRRAPTMRCAPLPSGAPTGQAFFSSKIGYLCRIDAAKVQAAAAAANVKVHVASLPGTFVTPDRPLAHINGDATQCKNLNIDELEKGFVIGDDRTFDDDPRFGLVVLAEIASRALSPAVNDSGTAIDVIGTFVRLFAQWCKPIADDEKLSEQFDRVCIPTVATQDMFDDAFTAIARDGAAAVEVAARLQKALQTLASMGDESMHHSARHHARLALARAEAALTLPEDLELVRKLCTFSERSTAG